MLNTVVLPVIEITHTKRTPSDKPTTVEQKVESYYRRQFHIAGRTSEVFIVGDMPQDQWIEHLIAGYKEREDEH